MTKIYTKTGDKGETSLLGGTRVSKHHDLIDLYGDVDDLNSHLGHLRSFLENLSLKDDDHLLSAVQNELFTLGSLLACEPSKRKQFKLKKLDDSLLISIEKRIDHIDTELEKLQNFILPAGHCAATWCHLCRTKTRALERKLVKSFESNLEVRVDTCIEIVNRLSDYLFNLSRYINKRTNYPEIIWGKKE